MNGFLGSAIWRAASEGVLIHNDIKRFRGKKKVLVALAPDRTHPEMVKFTQAYGPLKDELEKHNTVIFVEDHPRGPVHERFHCTDDEFIFALVGYHGDVEMQAHFTMLPDQLRTKLKESAPTLH